MKCKVIRGPALGGICVLDMPDGAVAKIVLWDDTGSLVGQSVQRHGEELILIGQPSKKSWSRVFTGNAIPNTWNRNRVRLLEAGDSIVIEEG